MDDALLSTDGMSLYSMLAVGVVILVAIGLLVWNLRRRGHMAFIRGGSSRQPRLAVLDATAVDARRRLVLVRRDNVEHLIMIGGPSDIVVERGISRAAMRAAQQDAAAQQAAAPQAAKPAQRPQPQKAPPPPKPAEPIATEPLNIPAAKPAEKPPEQPKTGTAAAASAPAPDLQKPDLQKKAETPPRPVPETKPAVEQRPPMTPEKPAPELAAVAVSAAVAGAAASPADKVEKSQDTAVVETDIMEEPLIRAEKPEDDTITAELEDVLDAARDLVLPERETTPPVHPEAAEAEAKTESTAPGPQSPVAAAAAGIPVVDTAPKPAEGIEAPPTVTADELIADFDRVLEAEMSKAEKQKLAVETPEPVEAPEPEKEETVKPPAASLEDEMKKLLGDLTVKH